MVATDKKEPERMRACAATAGERTVCPGEPRLLTVSADEHFVRRQSRRVAWRLEDMPRDMVERIAGNRMAIEHAVLDGLLDD